MISVCMTTYNGEKFIKEQIESIISQLGKDDELIVSDDGSTDTTLDIIKKYNDSRIRILHHKKKKNLAKKRNARNFYYTTDNIANAIENAKGDYIFLSDQDDIFMPNKICKMVDALRNSDCVLCNYLVIDSNGQVNNCFQKKPMFSKSVLLNLIRTPFLGCCMAFTRDTLNYVFPFPKGVFCHDLWIGSICAFKKKITFLEEPLHKYRVHENNVSPSVTRQSCNPVLFKIYYRCVFLYKFFIRIVLKK